MDMSDLKTKFNKMLGVVILKNIIIYFLIFIFSIGIVSAGTEDFSEAKKLINTKIPCSKLTENQFEIIGDYFMEQMHPGEAHEVMDKMMGGEGSESLRQMHIAIAKRLYCNDISGMTNYGMMGIMMGYGGMRNMMGYNFGYGTIGSGYGFGYLSFVSFLSFILLIGLIILIYLGIIKLWKEIRKTK